MPIPRDFSQQDPKGFCHLYSTSPLCYGHLSSNGRNLATSRSSRPIPWVFSYETPMHDPTCRSNGPPTIRIQRLSSSRSSCLHDLEYQMFGPLPCEHSSLRDLSISDTCPSQMDGSNLLATSPLVKSNDFFFQPPMPESLMWVIL
jgi:hypothetical protein